MLYAENVNKAYAANDRILRHSKRKSREGGALKAKIRGEYLANITDYICQIHFNKAD